MKIKVRYTQKELKHPDGLTFVAQRPLMGQATWYQNEGASIYGRHFAWMPENSDFRQKWIDYNVKMDARLVKRVSDEAIKHWYRQKRWRYKKEDIEEMIEKHFDYVVSFFCDENNDEEIEIE